MDKVRLTQFSHGSGCGCKIEPKVLEDILSRAKNKNSDPRLIVGSATKDDAAVYEMENGMGLISTADFFMPIVDDAYNFGRIAAANSISDVYAMGGKPLLAIAILGWPVDKLPAEIAGKVLEGAQDVCRQAGIMLAGGHSIDNAEPIFGLSVNGTVELSCLKKNSTAQPGDLIYMTKKIGTGILAKAMKMGKLKTEHETEFIRQLVQLNSLGEKLGKLKSVSAMTDITGFGLLGHLIEVCEASGVSAEIRYDSVPLMNGIKEYISQMMIPDNTYRNWNAVENKTEGIGAESLYTLCDPQTNGGLLFTINESRKREFEEMAGDQAGSFTCIGKTINKKEKTVFIH